MTSHGSKWLSLLGDSSWLAVAQRKRKTHSWFENSFIVTNNFVAANGTKPHSLQALWLERESMAEMIIPAHSRLAEHGC